MRALVVVPLDPVSNDPPGLIKRLERVLPDTLLFRTPKKPFDHSMFESSLAKGMREGRPRRDGER